MPSLYKMKHEPEVEEILEEMRKKISHEFGVTLVGNRLTVRWTKDGQLVDCHMIIENVTTVEESANTIRMSNELQKIYKKYPGVDADFYHAENGEWPK